MLFLFLGELRSAIVVIAALPLAMLIAFIFMGESGLSANLMSLAGLAVGIGMLVDGAVVMVENAFRILAEQKKSGGPVDKTGAVLAAAREVANPIGFAILIIVVVFLPLFALQGLEGKLFQTNGVHHQFRDGGLAVVDPNGNPSSRGAGTQTTGGARYSAGKSDQEALLAIARMVSLKQAKGHQLSCGRVHDHSRDISFPR